MKLQTKWVRIISSPKRLTIHSGLQTKMPHSIWSRGG